MSTILTTSIITSISSLLAIMPTIIVVPEAAIQVNYCSITLLSIINCTSDNALLTSSFSQATLSVGTGRLCTITGTALLANAPITANLRTWGKSSTQTATGYSLIDIPITVYSDYNGNFALTLLPPGDMSPTNLYYVININGAIITTTSFPYFSGTKDISLITERATPPTTAIMYGYIKNVSNMGIPYSPAEISLDRSCLDITTGITILQNMLISKYTDANGVYSAPLIPTDNLFPYGRYYQVNESNSLNYKDFTVPEAGGLIDNAIITNEIVGNITYPLEYIPADINEPASILPTPTTIYDSLTRIRGEIQALIGVPWQGIGNYISTREFAIEGSNTGNLLSSGTINITNSLTTQGIKGSQPIDAFKIESSLGLGASILQDSFGNTLYGLVSFKVGAEITIPGDAIKVYYTTSITGLGNVVSLITAADAVTAASWSTLLAYSYVEMVDPSLGKYILHIGFNSMPVFLSSYKIFYKIRGV